jgi:hypothetical protein
MVRFATGRYGNGVSRSPREWEMSARRDTSLVRRLRLLSIALSLSTLVLASPLGSGVASAASVAAGATFNNPIGSKYDQNAIIRKLKYAIDGTTSGQTIRMAFFSLTVASFADKLIAAHKRGVNVRLLQDDHELGTDWKRLVSALGSKTSNRSWALVCHRSCVSDENPSYLHAKLYMFSRSYSTPLVVMMSSANPTWTQARVGWNDMYTITGNSTIYNASKLYFEKLTAGALKDRSGDQSSGVPINLYFTATSGKYKTYYFPKGGAGWDDDPMYGVMSNIRCTGVASGYGSNGRTVVKIAMYQWSTLRVRLAEKLWSLDNAGCIVEVIYNPSTTDATILSALTKSGGKYGGVKIIKALDDPNRDGTAEHFLHNKYMIVNGSYAGDTSSKIVFSGSANWTNSALHYGNEIMFKVSDSAVYGLYLNQWNRLYTWVKNIPPPPTAPPPTPKPTVKPSPTIAVTPRPTGTLVPTAAPTTPPTAPPTLGPPSPSVEGTLPPGEIAPAIESTTDGSAPVSLGLGWIFRAPNEALPLANE